MFSLRDYQIPAVEAAVNHVRYRRPLHGYIKAPGGSGKSIMIAATSQALCDMGLRVIILARSERLLRQNKAKLAPEYQDKCGIYCASLGGKDASQLITVASIQSIAKLKDVKFDVALVDECDEIDEEQLGDSQYWSFFRVCGNPQIIGFTATPFRTRTGKIKWGEEIASIPLPPLIEQGYLVPPVNKVGAAPDLSGVKISLGEYAQEELENIYLEPELLEITMQKLLSYGATRSHPVVFCQSLKHADILAASLEANGESCRTVSGDTDKDELNDIIIPDFEAGAFKWLLNCQLFTVGVDIPCIDMVAIARATKSKRLFEQMTYRGTRPFAGKKDFLLLDMGGNLIEHGALGSPYRGKEAKKSAPKSMGKICPSCEDYVEPLNAKECSACGHQFPETERPKIDHADAPDTRNQAVYTGDIVTYDVYNVVCERHKSKTSGNESIRVDYFCDYGKYGNISEWLSVHHTSEFARSKAAKFFVDRGVHITTERLLQISLDDLVLEANRLPKPVQITVDHSEKFPRIISYTWPPKEPIVWEDELSDEIPF